MAFTFTVPVGDVSSAINKVKEAVAKQSGATFNGDTSKGSFSGSTAVGTVEGNYTVNGNNVSITITKKPFVVPQSTVESKIRDWFKG